MASLVKCLCESRIKTLCKYTHTLTRSISVSSSKHNWNKDWKPGPYPTAEAERVAAAKKYGLRREDYEPYPDDGFGYGDYPKLQPVTGHLRDPYYDWDIPYLERNYGEPMLAEFHIYNQERVDPNAILPYPGWVMWACFLGVMSVIGLAFYITQPYPQTFPLMAKQMPFTSDGEPVVHYTFEPADS